MRILTAVAPALLASVTALLPGQVGPDPTWIVQNMAQNVERASDARRLYVYDKNASTGLWTSGVAVSRRVARYEERRYVVTGAYGQVLAVDALKGECRYRELVEPYTLPGFLCPGLEAIAGAAGSLIVDLLDEGKSLDGVPYWLLPLRPAYLRFFQFALKGKGEFHGRPAYIIDLKPARATSPRLPLDDPYYGARAWEGTLWVDTEEAQLARVEARSNPARGLFSHTAFGIEYERVSKDAWFPASSCNVLWGGVAGARVSFQNSDFRRMDVLSQIEYVSSTIRYH